MVSAAEQLASNLNLGAFSKAEDLKRRIWFTLGALLIYRLGTHIPLPGVNADAFAGAFKEQSSGILGMFNMFGGGALQRLAIFALNIMPYISASIIMQLMSSINPKLEALKRELTKSIDGLLETSEFMIVQYSNAANAKIVGEAGGWQQASPAGKRSIKPHIGLLEAMGSTFPLPAFEKLAEIKPRPDVVYFLTDGDFNGDPDQVTDEILKLVLPWRIPVHTICVDTEGSEARMRRIAKQTRGTFTMIRGTGGGP